MFSIPPPELQVSFALLLQQIRESLLQTALLATVAESNISDLDKQLAELVPADSLAVMAGQGLRAELVFPCPLILRKKPQLLGYYRLLYGFSQKEFYTSKTGAAQFKAMEGRGLLSMSNDQRLEDLCRALCISGHALLSGMGSLKITPQTLDELTLLTLGPQLRGGANVRKGSAGIRVVFNVIKEIVGSAIMDSNDSTIVMTNAAGRKVIISFAPDPDIIIQIQMTNEFRNVIAIEVKAGLDFSNIHNRLGEAEKSHQKARRAGFAECWTVVNVDPFDAVQAAHETPSTNRFYRMAHLTNQLSAEYQDFRDRMSSLIGI